MKAMCWRHANEVTDNFANESLTLNVRCGVLRAAGMDLNSKPPSKKTIQ